MRRFRQRGVALLVAITIFAIATTLAAAITYNKAMAARRAAATFTLEQALQAGMAAEALAAMALETSATAAKTTLDQEWAQPFPPTEIEGTGIWIAATVEDLSARFNLNSVVRWDAATSSFVADPDQVEVFRHLLNDLDIDVRRLPPTRLAAGCHTSRPSQAQVASSAAAAGSALVDATRARLRRGCHAPSSIDQ
jgi:type II secretory pathway component PulK